MGYRAVHLDGGNTLDDVRLDMPASFAAQDEWLESVSRVSVRTNRMRSRARRAAYRYEPYRLREALVNSGLRRQWYEEFREYWEQVIGGRPLTVADFHNLRWTYRVRAHYRDDEQLEWQGPETHLANWQQPQHLFQTIDFVYRSGLHPAWEGSTLFDLLRPGMRVLEYGCAIAPLYRTWRTFMSDVPSAWLLADIPTFAFHYARHAYGRDAEASFGTIENFDDPLGPDAGMFDMIVVQAVFEHLDRPRFVAEYLLDHLEDGGLFWFEYSTSQATGLDTPTALRDRRDTLDFLASRLDVVRGELRIDERPLGQTVGRKRSV
jgi:SAM-dependent methyltransferase